ncbi:MAG: hypothetical protein IKK47_04825 [Ruminococcus sp.]|nr:hypothetical protein [Ruminococcus sp.]
MTNSNGDKELEKIYEELREMNSSLSSSSSSSSRRRISGKSEGDSLLGFFVGLLMLAGGLFMIFNNLYVSSSWGRGYIFHIGSFNIPNGMVMFPIVVGIAMLFLMERKVFGWVVVAIGIVIVLLSIMLSTQIHWRTTSAYVFIIMFGLTAAGAGLVIRELFRNRD